MAVGVVTMDPETLIRELGAPGAWGKGAHEPEVIQTHISVLFLVGDRVYKIKKPVDLGFLDFTDVERRRHFCEEELRLNRRLAAHVYLGVAPLLRSAAGELRVGTPGRDSGDAGDVVVDWVVCMRRLPANRMLDVLLDAGEVDNELIGDLARVLAEFHGGAARGPLIARHGAPAAVAFNVRENFEQLAPFVPELVPRPLIEFLASRAEAFLAERTELLEMRVAKGHVCEGHGDLHAGNICATTDGLAIYDCLEFSDRFRCGDVAVDLAFLVMDLDLRGFSAFGGYLVHRYGQIAADPELAELMPFYKAYRAVVKAKVAAITSRETEVAEETRAVKRLEALRYLHLAARYELGPARILMCGLPASGKSTVARHLANTLDAARLRSDLRRKQLAGLSPSTRIQPGYGAGMYSAEQKARTYDSLLESAMEDLGAGRSVVVDASFAKAAERERFLAAARARGHIGLVVHVRADERLTRARLLARANDSHEPSDADVTVWEAARAEFEPPLEVDVMVESASRPLEEEAGALLVRWIEREAAGAP